MSYIKKIFLFSAFFIINLKVTHASTHEFFSPCFTFDDTENVTGCHVTLSGRSHKGLGWTAREVQKNDIDFLTQLYKNQTVMSGFAGGETRDRAYVERRVNDSWIPRFKNGNPHGGLTLLKETDRSSEPQRIGYLVAGGGEGRGVSEVAYALCEDSCFPDGTPGIWGQGVISSAVGAIVQEWGPEVRRLGTDINIPAAIQAKFQCFSGAALERFDATASPSNPGSWKALKKNGFCAASFKVEDDETVADFDGKELTFKDWESDLITVTREYCLPIGKRFKVVGLDGDIYTVSQHPRFKERMKLHFEYQLPGTK
tara:strand:- start:1086 stop:2024 length:939 start_codon:yes stop_codon:yes gene_type:complete